MPLKKYFTDEERIAARKEAGKRYRAKRKFQLLPENDIMDIGLNLYTKTATPRALRLEAHNMIYGPSLNLYTKTATPKEIRQEAHDFFTDVLPIKNVSSTTTSTKDRMKYSLAKKQIGLAVRCINDHKRGMKHIRSFKFDWDNMAPDEREYLFNHIGQVIKELCSIAELNSKWVVKYSFDDKSIKTRKLNFDTAPLMINQLEKENFLDSVADEFSIFENEEYDFFPVEIRELKYLEFVDVEIKGRSRYKKIEAGFWRWILNVPLDLTKYQIFNALNERTVKQMTNDNCIIYACINSGVNEDIISHMREVFRNRFISIGKLDTIGKECGLKFTIRYDTDKEKHKSVEVGFKPGKEIKLVLVNQHYMIDRDIFISPYYIHNWKEINKDRSIKHWEMQRKYLISGKSNGKYYINREAFDIVDVLRALFDIHAFRPITQSDIITYSSSLYKEKLDDISSLEYNPKYCTKLKAPPSYNQ